MKIYLSILLFLFFSCSNSKEATPKNIVSKTVFASILKEIHLEKASFELNKTKDLKTAKIKLTNAYYNIFKSHKISEEVFNTSLDYYSKNPKKLEQIYSNALEQLTNERSKLGPQETN